MKNLYRNKGITLIALVITIIVLLILAGISIAMVTGENGMIDKSVQAYQENKREETREKIQLEVLGSYDEDGLFNMNILKEKLEENLGIDSNSIMDSEDEGGITFPFSGYEILVDSSGKVSIGEDVVEDEEKYIDQAINSNQAIPNNKKIINVTNKAGITEWLPYYFDGTYDYIISYDYLNPSVNEVFDSSTYIKKTTNTSYPQATYWSNVPNMTTEVTESFWRKYTYTYTSNNNTKCVASLLNTKSWTSLLGNYGLEAIGSPSIEMIDEAYKVRYGSSPLTLNYSSSTGVQISGDLSACTDRAFEIKETNKCDGYWIATPTSAGTNYVYEANYSGQFHNTHDYSQSSADHGLRPIVQLKKGIRIRQRSDGDYELFNVKTGEVIL